MKVAAMPSTAGLSDSFCEMMAASPIHTATTSYPSPSLWSRVWWSPTSVAFQLQREWPPGEQIGVREWPSLISGRFGGAQNLGIAGQSIRGLCDRFENVHVLHILKGVQIADPLHSFKTLPAPRISAGIAARSAISAPMAAIVFSPRQEAAQQEYFRAPYRQAMGAISNLCGADEDPVNTLPISSS